MTSQNETSNNDFTRRILEQWNLLLAKRRMFSDTKPYGKDVYTDKLEQGRFFDSMPGDKFTLMFQIDHDPHTYLMPDETRFNVD